MQINVWRVGMDPSKSIPTNLQMYLYWCSVLQELQIFEPGNSEKIKEAEANCLAFSAAIK